MCGTVHFYEQCKAQICEPFHQSGGSGGQFLMIISVALLMPILLNKSEASWSN